MARKHINLPGNIRSWLKKKVLRVWLVSYVRSSRQGRDKMPQLLRLRFCNIGPRRARMDDLTLSMEDITTGRATHSAIWLRNGGGKTTLIRLIFWLLCPDKPMP